MTVGAPAGFFDQIGVSNVIWLDDLFDVATVPGTVEIVERIASALADGKPLDHPKLSDLTSEDSPEEWATQVQTRLDANEQEEFLARIAVSASAGSLQADYSPGEVDAVVSSLGGTIRRVGLASWPTRRAELIALGTSGAVFMVDREMSVNGAPTNVGDQIVQELVAGCADDAVILVLTHSVGPEGTEALCGELATDLDIATSRLGVVSKRPGGGSLADSVRAAIRITLTRLTCAVVTARIVKVMTESLTVTERSISDLPVDVLDRAVFENSLEEGASEIDVFSRILTLRQRADVDEHIAGALDDVHSPLARMRKLRVLQPLPESPPTDHRLLGQWRQDEIFDSGPRLNALRSPVTCGDVFLKDGTNRSYMLLGQPCDLTVRANGTRSAREAVVVKIASFKEGGGVPQNQRYFEVPPLEGASSWAVDFKSWVSVDLEILEWASFNSDGRVMYAPVQVPPAGLLPGWEKRFIRARSRFKEGRQYCLSLGNISDRVAKATASNVEFPYRRIARLRSPRAAGVYAAFAAFHARAAFDHDFAKGLGGHGVAVQQSDPGPGG